MKKARFNYWILTALFTVMALILVQGVSANKATNSPASDAALDEPNLSSEARTVNSFGDDLVAYDKKRAELSKKASLTNEEFNALQRTGDDLKGRVSQLRDAVQSTITKLKASGRWDHLDEDVLAKLTDSRNRDFIRDN